LTPFSSPASGGGSNGSMRSPKTNGLSAAACLGAEAEESSAAPGSELREEHPKKAANGASNRTKEQVRKRAGITWQFLRKASSDGDLGRRLKVGKMTGKPPILAQFFGDGQPE
jgi:hypothetical protein